MAGAASRMLVEARKRAGLSQADLAARAGVARTSLSMYESGSREPGADTFVRLLEAAGTAVSAFRFTDQEVRAARKLVDLLELADALPHRWPGDDLQFPTRFWKRS